MTEPGTPFALRRRRRRARRVLGLFSLAVALGLTGVGCGLVCRPGWYHPPSVDFARLDDDRDEVVRVGDRIGDALNARRAVEIEIDEARLNRLLAAGGDAWPEPYRWELRDADDPLVDFAPGAVRVGVTLTAAGTPVVLSCRVEIAAADDELRIRVRSVRLGALPVPARLVRRAVQSALREAGAAAVDGSAAAVIPNDFVWPNGRKRCRIASIEFTESSVRIRLEPR